MPSPNDSLEALAGVLIRCFVFGLLLLLIWFGFYVLMGDWVLQVHRTWFDLTRHEFDLINYCGMGLLKLSLLLLFLVPYLAVRTLLGTQTSLWFHLVVVVALIAIPIGVTVLDMIFSPPGGEQVIDEAERPDDRPDPPASSIEQLRSAWDSESYADWPVAELLAEMSEKAYLPPVDADPNYRELGFEEVIPVVKGSMMGYFVSADDTAVIVFCGTDDNADWFANLRVSSAETPQGAIHKGFYEAYQSLKPQIMTLLHESRPKHLWTTGHSLGGALAVVCAYDLIEIQGHNIDGVITFGQPMVAREQLCNHLDTLLLGRYAHYVNGSDIVPKVPPGYNHCGSLVWFTKDGVKRSSRKRRVYGAPGAEYPPRGDEAEIVPLSEEEFLQWQAALREADAEPNRAPDGTPLVRGDLPIVKDHEMWLYLQQIRKVREGTDTDE